MEKNKTFCYHEGRYQCEDYPNNKIKSISNIVLDKKPNEIFKFLKYKRINISSLFGLNNYDRKGPIARRYCMAKEKSKIDSHSKNANNISQDKNFDIIQKRPYFCLNTDFVVNSCCQTCEKPECLNPFINPLVRERIYRCQLNVQEETCCCSCNSDAMFEVMKSLYDCYKKKNCDNCDCILCGYLPKEERRLGEQRKSAVSVAVETASAKVRKKEKMKKAKAAGLLTPLEGKTPEQRDKIIRGLAKLGIPLPEGKTASEKELINKVRKELGLPPEPKTANDKEKYKKAEIAGVLTPLDGKSQKQKEKILRKLAELGIPFPEGRTKSENDLIEKIKASPSVKTPSERLRRAKAAGLITPLKGKTPEQKEKILKGLAMHGVPLPEPGTLSEKKLIDKVRADLGLPLEPKSPLMKERYKKAIADGLLTPLDGKTPSQKEKILRGLADLGLPLPEGRTPSEKALIANIRATAEPPPEMELRGITHDKLKAAKAAGLLTPIEGKSPAQKENIVRGLAKNGLPLPEGKTDSEKKLTDKIRKELGLPPEPKTQSQREKYAKAQAAGLLTPLDGKSPALKEKILRGQAEIGLPLPEGRTPSEKSLIAKIKGTSKPLPGYKVPSEKMRAAKAAGFLTPLEGKTPEQKEKILKGLAKHGIPLPAGKSPSDKKLIDKVRAEVGLPPEPRTPSIKQKYSKAMALGLITPLEGKTPAQKEKILRGQAEMGLPLPQGRTPSEKSLIARVKATTKPLSDYKVPSEKMRAAKAAGFLTPLEGKTPEQKQKILKGLAKHGIPLPEGDTSSEKNLIDKVRAEVGLPPEPKTPSIKQKYRKAMASGLITPLEGKTPAQKEKILRAQAEMGLPLPEGRTPSEKSLIARVKATTKPISDYKVPSKKMRAAKAAGFLTPLEGKTPEQKQNILKGLAKHGIPLPEGKTPTEKKLIDKVRAEVGLPPEPRTPSIKQKYKKAMASGLITPLEGKTPAQKEKILRGQAEMGLPLPEGRTPSEKSLIARVKATTKPLSIYKVPSAKMRAAKAAGFMTPLEGKTPEQKEKILKGLAKHGIPLPEGKTRSDKKLIDKVRADVGLPPEPRSPSIKQKYTKALADGLITPLEGKSPGEKEKILKRMAEAGIPLPEGRTPSEKALIAKVKAAVAEPVEARRLSQKLREAKAAGLLTPLQGKTPEQRQKILRGLVKAGLPLPEPNTKSEKALIDKIRDETGLPPEPDTPSLKEKYKNALNNGIITPLEGKTPSEKTKILKRMHDAGISLPIGRTVSEKALINKVKAGLLDKVPSEKIRAAKAGGLLTPLDGKTPEQKENIIRGLAKIGLPLPEGKTPSEKQLLKKVRAEMGLPPEPRTQADKEKMSKALAAGIVTPLEGKTPTQKEKILKSLAEAGIPLPEGRTPSEKSLIAKVKAAVGTPSPIPSEKIRKAKAEGLLTPLEGKTPAQKEKILKGLIDAGLPLPEGMTHSDKALIKKVRVAAGLPPEPTPSEKKGQIKTRSRGARIKSKGGIAEELQEIVKTTVCDRACGCDKKKIKFKHSYVKIRVTSPDMSSFCPCPNECIPGVKGGVIVDNEGIKVTVGRAEGIPPYNLTFRNSKIESDFGGVESYRFISVYSTGTVSSDFSTYKSRSNNKSLYGIHYLENTTRYCDIEHIFKSSPYNTSNSHLSPSYKYYSTSRKYHSEYMKTNTDYFYNSTSNMSTETLGTNTKVSVSRSGDTSSVFSRKSILKVASSVSLSTDSCTSHQSTISVISILGSTLSSVSSQYSSESDDNVEKDEHFNDKIDYSVVSTSAINDHLSECCSESVVMKRHGRGRRKDTAYKDDIIICRLSKSTGNEANKRMSRVTHLEDRKHSDHIVVLGDLNSNRMTKDVIKMANEMLSRNLTAATRSLFVLVPSDEHETAASSDVPRSAVAVQISHDFVHPNKVTGVFRVDEDSYVPPRGLKLCKRRRKQGVEEPAGNTSDTGRDRAEEWLFSSRGREHATGGRHVVGTDTTSDRPCCCAPAPAPSPHDHHTEEELYGSSHRFVASTSVCSIPALVVQPCEPPSPLECQETLMKLKSSPPGAGAHAQRGVSTPAPPATCRLVRPYPLPGYRTVEGFATYNEFVREDKRRPCERAWGTSRLPPSSVTPCCKLPHPFPLPGLSGCIEAKVAGRRGVTFRLGGECAPAPPADTRCRCKSCKDGQHQPCICTKGPGSEEKYCECPEFDSSESNEYLAYEDWACAEDFEWVSREYIMKVKSDMTQTMSGFKVSVSGKQPTGVMWVEEDLLLLEEDASFENFAMPPAEMDIIGHERCACETKAERMVNTTCAKENFDCQCPPPPPPIEPPPFILPPLPPPLTPFPMSELGAESPAGGPFNMSGMKLTVGAKGTTARGLRGLCCFDMLEECTNRTARAAAVSSASSQYLLLE